MKTKIKILIISIFAVCYCVLIFGIIGTKYFSTTTTSTTSENKYLKNEYTPVTNDFVLNTKDSLLSIKIIF